MRILHVIPAIAARYGGPSAAITAMCAHLRARAIDAVIATTDADGDGRLDVPLDRETTWEGVPTWFFKRDFSEAFKYSRGLSQWLSRHVRDFDVVHIHAWLSHAPLAAARVCRRDGVPYIVRPLGTLASWSLGRKAWRKRFLLSVAGRSALHDAAAIHCTTDEEWRDLESSFGLQRGFVIPLGVDLPESVDRDPHVPYVLAMSRLAPKKNFEALIDAFVETRTASGKAWRLIIAGSGDDAYQRQLAAQVAARSADDVIQFAGWVSGEQKQQLLSGASLFALPSKHENFGLAVLEAMAAGCPVVISRDVQLADAVQNASAGWTVETDGPSLRLALEQAMSDASMREARGIAARALAARYSWNAVANRLIEMYDTIHRTAHASAASIIATGAPTR